jgi:hypothetical protein
MDGKVHGICSLTPMRLQTGEPLPRVAPRVGSILRVSRWCWFTVRRFHFQVKPRADCQRRIVCLRLKAVSFSIIARNGVAWMKFGSEKLRIRKLISSQDLRPLARIVNLSACCSELPLPAFVESFFADVAKVWFPPLVSVRSTRSLPALSGH